MECTGPAFLFPTSFNKNQNIKIFQTLKYFFCQRRRNEIQYSDSAVGHFRFSQQQTLNMFLQGGARNIITLIVHVTYFYYYKNI